MDLLGKPLNPNKHLKEEFVSNLSGSSMLEIAALSTIVPALVVLRQWSSFAINGHFYATEVKRKKDDNWTYTRDWRGYIVALAMDFLCIMLPILFIFTVLSEWTFLCTILLIVLLLFCILLKRDRSQHLSSVRISLLSYRVSVVVITCLCILAVDFKIFPRRYAKTETYGTSLMDLGVGSFVVANSLVSRQARHTMSMTWKATLQSTSPLLFLGFARLIFTRGVDYQVHVGEYGVHWNFFFTLAAVSILTSIINIHPNYCGILGTLILIGYQICLVLGLSEYLLSNDRTFNFIGQNKEGLFSIFGYWGMYLIGVHIGYLVFFISEENIQRARIRVWILSVLFWLFTIILDNHVERVSRRMCNMAFVSLVLAQNFQVMSVLMLSDFVPAQKPLVFEEAYNRNLLGSFLLANILTGMVNLFVDTLTASSLVAFCILFAYAFILTAAVGYAGYYGTRLKFCIWFAVSQIDSGPRIAATMRETSIQV